MPCLVLVFWFLLGFIEALCPEKCTCGLSENGQRSVLCLRGGMLDPIPTHEMDLGLEILVIDAPDANTSNSLTLAQLFQHFKQLEEVRIKRSNLHQIGMHIFWGVPSLKVLDLSENRIQSVYDHNFRGLVNLVELDLSANRISAVQSGVFKHLTELRILNLERNALGELVPRMFLKLGKLHVLKISGNQFDDELNPEVFKDVPELHVLECRSCTLRRINTQLYHLLPYLTHLDLGANQIQFLTAEEFYDLRRLRSLQLDGNQLPVILELTFQHQHDLRRLNLARNRLAKITNTAFHNLTRLEELDIGYNRLDRLDSTALTPLGDNLLKLVLSGNFFGVALIRDLCHVLHRLEELQAAHMGLSELPKGALPPQLKKLNVSHNNLTRVDFMPRGLAELDARFNRIGELGPLVGAIPVVELEHNAWACTRCNLSERVAPRWGNLTCSSPRLLRGRSFASLRLDELPECAPFGNDADGDDLSDEKLGLVVGMCTMLVLFIVCVLFVVCSCMRRRGVQQEAVNGRSKRREEIVLDGGAFFCTKGEISFKFPLDLGVEGGKPVQVSTIDDINREEIVPNGI